MSSSDWHRMNDIVCELERNRERIISAKVHMMYFPDSIIGQKIPELEARHHRLYDDLYDLTAEMLRKAETEEQKS